MPAPTNGLTVIGRIFNEVAAWRKRFGSRMGFSTTANTAFDASIDNNYQEMAVSAAGVGYNLPTHKPCSSLNHFVVNIGQFVPVGEVRPAQTGVPGTPTGTVNGTAGSTSIAYKVVARAGSLQVASAAVTVTTANATLSAANSISLAWTPVLGANAYDIYRTSAAGTPSTTGLIGTLAAAVVDVIGSTVTGTMNFTDTGLTADSSTAPSANTTGGLVGGINVYGNLTVNALATPATPLIANVGTTGAATVAYKVVARSGTILNPSGVTAASSAGSTASSNATLSTTNYNTITWQPVPGAVSYDIYRTTAPTTPSTTGKIANVSDANTLSDTGLAGDSGTAPTANTTGIIASGTSGTASLASITDTNGNPEIVFTATASAVNGLTETNAALSGTVILATSGSDTNIPFTINTKGTGALTLAPVAAGGTVVVGGTAQTGAITVGSSSGTQSVLIGNGAGVATVSVAATGVAGNTVNVATGATAGAAVDTLNLATGNALSTAAKKVNIATGVPNTSGNNQVIIGGGVTSAVSVNAVVTSYQSINYIATEGGANNAITGTLTDAAGNNVTLAAGLRVAVKLAHSLQAGANTFALNGTSKNIRSHFNVANNIATAYVSTGLIEMMYDGVEWVDLSQ